MTKGAVAEQTGKVERSGLKEYFAAVEIVSEKDASTYRSVVSKYSLLSDDTWMIGNSPKSDINPALEAGLRAVYVPHERTWHLERTALNDGDGRLLVVEGFSDLRKHF